MRKWIFRFVFILVLAVFFFSAVSLWRIRQRYKEGEETYENAVSQFVQPAETENGTYGSDDPEQPLPDKPDEADKAEDPLMDITVSRSTVKAPFAVDFEALKAINEDIVGWIYCPGTQIHYPLLQCGDNSYYLHRSYDRSYLFCGSIFVEAANQPIFMDANTIIYGHNMRDGSMFEVLQDWKKQEFYDAHPYMWIITPEQDYVVLLFSGYTTTATSDAYQIFSLPGEDLNAYLQAALDNSDFTSNVELDPEAKYIMLSTCSYEFNNSRFVLHGMLVPAGSAGGKPIPAQ